MEATLRLIPRVIDTEDGCAREMTGISDGNNDDGKDSRDVTPSSLLYYETVCKGKNGHADTVRVTVDRGVLNPRTLFDYFLYLNDPTKVRAHGKQATGTGQCRICVFVPTSRGKEGAAAATADYEVVAAVREALEECRFRLGKEIGTEVRTLDVVRLRFWRVE